MTQYPNRLAFFNNGLYMSEGRVLSVDKVVNDVGGVRVGDERPCSISKLPSLRVSQSQKKPKASLAYAALLYSRLRHASTPDSLNCSI